MGMTVLRLSNKDFMANTDRALQQIASACNPPSPLGRGMGGEGSGLRYVGAEAVEDDGEPFEGKMKRLTARLREQQTEVARLDVAIAANLKELGYGG